MDSANHHCRNCGAALGGEFCARCGQREGRGDLYFSEAVGDVIGDLFTWDSRFWRTLVPLLFRPGFLSAEFNAGRRARYMPPFRLYIVISFVMFLVLSLNAGSDIVMSERDERDESSALVVGMDPNSLPEDVRARADAQLGAAPETNAAAKTGDAGVTAVDEDGVLQVDLFGPLLRDSSPAWMRALDARVQRNARRVQKDPGEYIDTLFEYLPQAMFLLLPLFAVMLKLFYLFSPFHYLQHLVFALHCHSFAYVVYLLSVLWDRVGPNLDGTVALLLALYLPLALRRTYASSWVGALGKGLLLYLAYGMVLALGLALAAVAVLAVM